MDHRIQKVLKKIEEQGFEAYIVGGYVRDYILGIDSNDIDICTNALPKDISNIFKIKNQNSAYGSVSFNDNKYSYAITTYRKESNYLNRKPQTIEYIGTLLEDLKRRDFTINSICMDSSGKILDLLNGIEDLKREMITVIGDTSEKLNEDPLRILRAIRFSIILNFKLDSKILTFINENKELIKTLSYSRMQEELNKIFASKNVIKGLEYLKNLKIDEILEIKYDKIVPVPDILGIWAQIDFSHNYTFNKSSYEIICKVKEILNKKVIDNQVLFDYGLYISTVSGEILGYERKQITQNYDELPIKTIKEMKLNLKDAFGLLNVPYNEKAKMLYKELINEVVQGNIKNDYETEKEYLINRWK